MDDLLHYLIGLGFIDPKDKFPIQAHEVGDPEFLKRKKYWNKSDYLTNVNRKYYGYQNPFSLACENGSEKVAALLLNLPPIVRRVRGRGGIVITKVIPVVEITDGKYGMISENSGDCERDIDYYFNINVFEMAEKFPNIKKLMLTHFKPHDFHRMGRDPAGNLYNPKPNSPPGMIQ